MAGALADATWRGRKPPSRSIVDLAFSAGEFPPVCAEATRSASVCPNAASRCPRRAPPDGPPKMKAGSLDLNDDDVVSRQELAVFLGQAAARATRARIDSVAGGDVPDESPLPRRGGVSGESRRRRGHDAQTSLTNRGGVAGETSLTNRGGAAAATRRRF